MVEGGLPRTRSSPGLGLNRSWKSLCRESHWELGVLRVHLLGILESLDRRELLVILSREGFKPILDFAHVTFACEHQNAEVLAAVVKRQ